MSLWGRCGERQWKTLSFRSKKSAPKTRRYRDVQTIPWINMPLTLFFLYGKIYVLPVRLAQKSSRYLSDKKQSPAANFLLAGRMLPLEHTKIPFLCVASRVRTEVPTPDSFKLQTRVTPLHGPVNF